jgi:DNA-binding PadR family transcriptional regulator
MLTQNDLLVLSLLLERPMHGYEISQAIKTSEIEVWFEISMPAIYYSLNKLRRGGMIAEARSRGNVGEKTIYHVTELGREQFFTSAEALLDSPEPIRTEYDLGIFVLNRIPQARALELLQKRIAFLQKWSADLEQKRKDAKIQPLQQAILNHAIATARLDIDWLTDITKQLQDENVCETTSESLMMLQGDFQDFYLPDLIKLIASGKHSGTLVASKGSVMRTLTFDKGHPHCASSHIGETAVGESEQVVSDIYDLFGWQQGAFTFDQRGCPQNGCVLLDVDANDLILSGARRLDSWDIIQNIVPSSDALFESCEHQKQTEKMELVAEERRTLAIADGLKDVTTIAREMGLTEFETSKILYGLYAVGLVQPADPNKSRLRRVFREFAELMCRSAIPYRTTPDEAKSCEQEVNRRCEDLPVRITDSRIEDHTDVSLPVSELANIYRTFLNTQHAVLTERLGKAIADELRQRVLTRISPDLHEILEQYKLLA